MTIRTFLDERVSKQVSSGCEVLGRVVQCCCIRLADIHQRRDLEHDSLTHHLGAPCVIKSPG